MREYRKRESTSHLSYRGEDGVTDMVEAACRIIRGENILTVPRKKENRGKMRSFFLGFATAATLSLALWLVFAL